MSPAPPSSQVAVQSPRVRPDRRRSRCCGASRCRCVHGVVSLAMSGKPAAGGELAGFPERPGSDRLRAGHAELAAELVHASTCLPAAAGGPPAGAGTGTHARSVPPCSARKIAPASSVAYQHREAADPARPVAAGPDSTRSGHRDWAARSSARAGSGNSRRAPRAPRARRRRARPAGPGCGSRPRPPWCMHVRVELEHHCRRAHVSAGQVTCHWLPDHSGHPWCGATNDRSRGISGAPCTYPLLVTMQA